MDGRDYELLAQQVSSLSEKVATHAERLIEVERVNAKLEVAALTMARALQEISRHWDAVYEAMRRSEEGAYSQGDLPGELSENLRRERRDAGSRESD
jgi:hypothetical protein